MTSNGLNLAVIPRDGIGREVIEAALSVPEAAEARHDINFSKQFVNGSRLQEIVPWLYPM